jgi:hypothetical protein
VILLFSQKLIRRPGHQNTSAEPASSEWLGMDKFYRYNATLQSFFEEASRLET